MSVEAMGRVWELDVSHREKIVLLRIADACDDGETFSVDISAAAKVCGVSHGGLMVCLARLHKSRLLIINRLACDDNGRFICHGVLTLLDGGRGDCAIPVRRA